MAVRLLIKFWLFESCMAINTQKSVLLINEEKTNSIAKNKKQQMHLTILSNNNIIMQRKINSSNFGDSSLSI
jgi:hypothetical protein